MTNRPILFSAPMVRALLDGTKTQTRRIMKPQPLGFGDDKRFAKGDRLWVRETYTMATPLMGVGKWPCYFATESEVNRMINGKWAWKWTPSIYMKREHSRLTLTVTDVRVQRLQEISEEDARDEGVAAESAHGPVGLYALLWETINGEGSWHTNPFVAAVTFTVERRNIDA